MILSPAASRLLDSSHRFPGLCARLAMKVMPRVVPVLEATDDHGIDILSFGLLEGDVPITSASSGRSGSRTERG